MVATAYSWNVPDGGRGDDRDGHRASRRDRPLPLASGETKDRVGELLGVADERDVALAFDDCVLGVADGRRDLVV